MRHPPPPRAPAQKQPSSSKLRLGSGTSGRTSVSVSELAHQWFRGPGPQALLVQEERQLLASLLVGPSLGQEMRWWREGACWGCRKKGAAGREAADLGCLIGLQGQEVGLPESTGSLAEGPEKGSLAEAGWRPQGSAGNGEKGTERRGRARENKTNRPTNRPTPRPAHHLHTVTIRGVGHITCKRLAARCDLFPHGQGAGDPHHQAPVPPRPPPPLGPAHSAFTRPVATSTTSTSGSPRLQLRLRPWQVLEGGSEGATEGPANRCSMVRV